MKKENKYRADLLLLGGILAMGALLALVLLLTQRDGRVVQVRVSGTVVETFPLGEDRRYEISGSQGGTNLLVIQNGEAWVEEASCPDGLCQNMGKISRSGQSVICLPNQVVVEILDRQGETEESADLDLIAG